MLSLLIADDHAIVRHGLRRIIAEAADIVVAGEAEGGLQTLRMLREPSAAYDILLLDISMPDKNGMEVLKQVRREFPKLPVLMLTMHAEDEFGVRALKAGAAGFLNKQTAPSELIGAIRQVAAGRKYISGRLAEELAEHLASDRQGPPHHALSTREYQTLCLIGSGNTLSETAAKLSLSPKTVSVYRARLLEKLNLRNNAEVMHYAMRHRLVELRSSKKES